MSKPRFFISSGEYSGDILASELHDELSKVYPGAAFFGITGPKMREVGIETISPQDPLSIMGFTKVLLSYPKLKKFHENILKAIRARGCDAAILVDSPGYHLKLAADLKKMGIPVIQYVAPKLWAWGEGRTKRMQRDISLLLSILPFEPSFFSSRGIPCKYVGTPLLERTRLYDRLDFKSLDLKAGNQKLCLLPGSRWGEIRQLLPVFFKIVSQLRLVFPSLEVTLPIAENLNWKMVCSYISGLGSVENITKTDALALGFIHIKRGHSLKHMSEADGALVASGTATLECALVGTPMVVLYRMSSLNFEIAKRVVQVPWVSLVNLLMQKQVVREFIQDIPIDLVVEELVQILTPGSVRKKMLKDFLQLREMLKADAARYGAQEIQAFFEKNRLAGNSLNLPK